MQPPLPSVTPTWRNDTYEAISPSRPELSAAGKTVIVAGAVSSTIYNFLFLSPGCEHRPSPSPHPRPLCDDLSPPNMPGHDPKRSELLALPRHNSISRQFCVRNISARVPYLPRNLSIDALSFS